LTYALVNDTRFSLHLRGKKRVDWTIQSASDALVVASKVFGKETMHMYIARTWSDDGIRIDGILPPAIEGFARG
jgi:hypothetical protein